MPEAEEALRGLPPGPKRRSRAALDAIRSDPGAGKELRLDLSGWRTYRVGRLRIVYRAASEVQVLLVGPRETIYQEAARLLRPLAERRGRTRGISLSR